MKRLIIIIALFSCLASQGQKRLFGNGFYAVRNNKFGWFGTSGTDSVGYVDSLKIKFFKPILPGSYSTSGVPDATLFPGYIIYNTDSLKHQYSNGTSWLTLPGTGGGGGGSGTVTSVSGTDGSGFDFTITNATTTPAIALTTSLTTGSIPYIGASGALSQNNANLFWDNTNVRLGIGTATPSERLHIVRSADALALMQFTNTNTGVSAAGGVKLTTDGGDAYIYRTSIAYVSGLGDDLVFQEAGGGDMVWFTANEKMRLLNNGNFGIGINNPGRVLDVFHGSQAQIRLSAVAGSSYSEIFGTGGNFYLSGSATTNTLVAFGGSTSSFPALRRSGTLLQVRLADNSAYADLELAGRAYDATTWNGSNRAVSEDAIRDEVVSITSSLPTSGEYTPTLTATTNLDAVTLIAAHYYRTGNFCIVYLNFTADATATGFADFGVSLPFASEISASSEVIGSGALTAGGGSVEVATISGDATNNRAVVSLGATATSAQAYFVSFSYKITPP